MKQQKNKMMMAVWAAGAVLLLGGCSDRAMTIGDLSGEKPFEVVAEEDAEPDLTEKTETQEIYVFVCGEVASPGVVVLRAGSRAGDALEAAGGLTESGDEAFVNLAEPLKDGQKLYFPSVAEAAAQTSGNGSAININTADAEKLCELPGIGRTRAEAIVDYRKSYGNFEKPEDLMRVSGIGEASFAKLRPYITVN